MDVENHNLWARTLIRGDICAFLERPFERQGRSVLGFVLQREGRKFENGRGIMHGGEVNDAEIYGALEVLRVAVQGR